MATTAPAVPGRDWFTQARFGMFVHFGLYSMAARHEWVMSRERMPAEVYERYADVFDPDLFDARAIARAAKEAGMGYVVLTTKHHDGFALWDSGVSDYTSAAACGRDLVAEFTGAVRAEGLRVGLYHSLIDWHHPDFTVDYLHPRRDDPGAQALNATRDMGRYRAYLHEQVRELLTGYGRVDYLFFDYTYPEDRDGWRGKYPEDWAADELLALVRKLQPDVVVNDRLGVPGDLVTPEQYQPAEPMRGPDGAPITWEACQTLNGSWGYDRDNTRVKTPDLLVRMLVDTVSKGGNLLLNIGPDGRGAIPARDATTLAALARWMRLHRRSVVGAGPADPGIAAAVAPGLPPGAVLTQRGDRLYVHLFAWPFEHVHLRGLADRVRYAQLLNDGSELATVRLAPGQQAWNTTPGGQPPGTLTLRLPTVRPDVEVPVVELFLADR
ncbi:alpha-L-fucosidase [Jiangella rhizosphaerae]|uniref:alpha-L-fucosidase n=1 Tax=Jiangella rhizosphaerae TaxID=2293569 RepID=A0A418KHQ0_9ACTN|nr:alpha-L-fucosidase [Jiangella rhizosphaerae]RIQ12066.1 alpha-L-fucosidase [Jiangella rhizosphaerae]